jgi:hypothetical protein
MFPRAGSYENAPSFYETGGVHEDDLYFPLPMDLSCM